MRKKLTSCISLLLLAALTTSAVSLPSYATSEEGEKVLTAPANWAEDGVLKILTIGNSFSDDSMEYVYQIASDVGVKKIVLGNLYIGGCTLYTHIDNAKNNKAAYEYRTNTSGSWSTTRDYKMSTAIASENWDYISLQQASGSSGMPDTYNTLDYLVDYVSDLCPSATLVWNMTWAYQQNSTHGEFYKYNSNQMTMYSMILNAVKTQVQTKEKIAAVIPTGTAIQNARTSYVGDNLTRDGYHLSYDFGRYIAGLTFVRMLTGLSIDNVTFRPSNIDENLQKVAIESANNAVQTPFAPTSSTYDKRPGIDTSNLVLLDLELTPLAYWNTSDSVNHHKLISSAANSKNFYATKRFTKNEIPVGSIITIESGWQYRPERWKDDQDIKQSNRPGNTSVSTFVVTEDWWEGYTYKAFNISKTSGVSLIGSETAAENALHIFVPEYAVDTTGYHRLDLELTPFGYYNSDGGMALNTGADNSKNFYATRMFTKEDIPVGSVIVIQNGWQYRPERWPSKGGRPGNTSVTTFVVTEDFWDGFTQRAFNISKLKTPSLKGQEISAENALRIYVPGELPEKDPVIGYLQTRQQSDDTFDLRLIAEISKDCIDLYESVVFTATFTGADGNPIVKTSRPLTTLWSSIIADNKTVFPKDKYGFMGFVIQSIPYGSVADVSVSLELISKEDGENENLVVDLGSANLTLCSATLSDVSELNAYPADQITAYTDNTFSTVSGSANESDVGRLFDGTSQKHGTPASSFQVYFKTQEAIRINGLVFTVANDTYGYMQKYGENRTWLTWTLYGNSGDQWIPVAVAKTPITNGVEEYTVNTSNPSLDLVADGNKEAYLIFLAGSYSEYRLDVTGTTSYTQMAEITLYRAD